MFVHVLNSKYKSGLESEINLQIGCLGDNLDIWRMEDSFKTLLEFGSVLNIKSVFNLFLIFLYIF